MSVPFSVQSVSLCTTFVCPINTSPCFWFCSRAAALPLCSLGHLLRSAWPRPCLMLMWALSGTLSVCHPVCLGLCCALAHPSPVNPSPHIRRCAITATLRTNPPPLRSGWAAPSSAPAPAKTPSRPTTAPNRCPLCPRRENLATKSSQSFLELKKVRGQLQLWLTLVYDEFILE